ncbi:MAG: hypothetical protein N3G22_00005, partial [Candidatus Micrarchaeota archaeon]|nr:hypothetical protein [Candidatus Micrarchaeota archaeon]
CSCAAHIRAADERLGDYILLNQTKPNWNDIFPSFCFLIFFFYEMAKWQQLLKAFCEQHKTWQLNFILPQNPK